MASSAPAQRDRPPTRTSFIPELQTMMFALGDARKPLHETAALVEDIVHTQLITMLQQACDGAVLRGSRVISAEDILFLMRRDKRKVQRLLKFLQFRDYKSKLMKSLEEDETDKCAVAGGNKRQRLVLDFLSGVDQTGDFLSLTDTQEVDEVKQERLERLERQTRGMDSAQYSDFCESRQLSFAKKASKFRDWLDCSSLEVKPNAVAMEILSYLAYETVAQLVDLALLVKQDMTPQTSPFRQAISASYIHYLNTEVKKDPDSPETTPPSTPGSSHQSKPLPQGNGGLDSSKARQRKRKKGVAVSVEGPSGAIMPCHLREAFRRYCYRHTSAYRRSGMVFLAC